MWQPCCQRVCQKKIPENWKLFGECGSATWNLNARLLSLLPIYRERLLQGDQGSMLWSQFSAIFDNFRRKIGVFLKNQY
jgi:hypothetical protein